MDQPERDVVPPEYPRLDYAALVCEYENRLETIERGFGMGADFLDAWVPDDDHNKSLFYLFEAASRGKLPGLSVELTPDLLSSIDGQGLLEALRGLGGVHVAHGESRVVLTVSFDGSLGEASALDELPVLSSLHRAYRDRLVRETRTITHRLDTGLDDAAKRYSGEGLRVLEASFQDGSLLVAVDPQNNVVKVMRYAHLSDNVGVRLLELFCRWLEGSPIEEIAEHGAIRLENTLRDPHQPPPVRGLITPENAGPHFSSLNQVARELFRRYREERGLGIARNCNEQSVMPQWLRMSNEERIEAIAKAIQAFLDSRWLDKIGFRIVNLANTTQVYVTLEGYESERERRSLFRALDKHLRTILEPRLELYLPSAVDRLKRDEQSDLLRTRKEEPR